MAVLALLSLIRSEDLIDTFRKSFVRDGVQEYPDLCGQSCKPRTMAEILIRLLIGVVGINKVLQKEEQQFPGLDLLSFYESGADGFDVGRFDPD